MEIMDRNHKEETRKRKELEDTMKEKLNKFQIIIDEKMAAFSHMSKSPSPFIPMWYPPLYFEVLQYENVLICWRFI